MNLKDYVNQLNEIIKANPKHANLLVIYAMDDEGNEFSKIGFSPSLGNYNSDDNYFTQEENFEDIDEEERVINSICIN